MKIERCLYEENLKTILEDLVKIPRNIIISMGPVGCLNALYFEAKKYHKSDFLYMLPTTELDIISGEHMKKLEDMIKWLISTKKSHFDSIIIYETCVDVLTGTDFKPLIKKMYEKYRVIVKVLERGGIISNKKSPRKGLERIISELKEELPKIQNFDFSSKNIIDEDIEKYIGHHLPPIVSDFSGALSTLYSPKILKILVSPSGCGTPAINDEIRCIDNSLVYVTNMKEVDVLYGNEDEIIKTIKTIPELKNSELIAVIGTAIPSLLEIDISKIAKILEKEYQIPLIAINTTGFESYYSGISKALTSLGEKLLKEKDCHTKDKCVNIIGYSPFSFGKYERLEEFFEMLKKLEIEVNCIFSHNLSLEKIRKSKKASLNLVIGHEGIALADFMKENLKIPYLLTNIVGKFGIEKTKSELIDFFNLKDFKILNSLNNLGKDPRKVLIISSPLLALNIKEFLENDFNFSNIKSVSFLKKERKLKKIYSLENFKNLEILESEDEIQKFITKYLPDIIIADTVFKTFAPTKSLFIPLPHFGYTTRLYTSSEYEYCGEKGYEYFKKYIKE